MKQLLLLLFAVTLLTGCKANKIKHVPNWKKAAEREVDPLPVPNELGPFSVCQKCSPAFWIANADDPEPPEWYRPGEKGRNWKWNLRNPFHNLTFYVIGIADKEFVRVGNYPHAVFNPDGGWTWSWSRSFIVPYPYVSYIRNDFQFYFGWRERGNFGIKLRGLKFWKKKAKEESEAE